MPVYLANLHRAAYETNVAVWLDGRAEGGEGAGGRELEGEGSSLPPLPTNLLQTHNVILIGTAKSALRPPNQTVKRALDKSNTNVALLQAAPT